MILEVLTFLLIWSLVSFAWMKWFMPPYGPEKVWHLFFVPPLFWGLVILITASFVVEIVEELWHEMCTEWKIARSKATEKETKE